MDLCLEDDISGPSRPSVSLWMDALDVPVGSNTPLSTQDFDDLKQALMEIAHAKQRLARDPQVSFVCDVCERSLGQNEVRHHCYDCQDFDTCHSCRLLHKIPFHVLEKIAPPPSQSWLRTMTNEDEDPLVCSLLQPKQQTVSSSSSSVVKDDAATVPKTDRTVVWCRDRLRRFLAAVLDWWPLLRASCVHGERLPFSIDEGLAQKLRECRRSNDSSSNDVSRQDTMSASASEDEVDTMLMNTVSVVLDTLSREEIAFRGL